MADVSKAPTWFVGGRREVKIVLRDAEVDALKALLARQNDAFSRGLASKLEGM